MEQILNALEQVLASKPYKLVLSSGKGCEYQKIVVQQKGDYFQMAANYYYGIGAHSMIFIEDYDPETDSVTWADSNMKGEKRNGERYGYVQYEANKEIDWFVDAYCT